ncbi:hypothetical protein GQ54DRAFT_299735 [Martensiomyces pterosporus]|nr:hypothetical protein GQ54DRAFT_299735 [Martensiomyces pterosporus]
MNQIKKAKADIGRLVRLRDFSGLPISLTRTVDELNNELERKLRASSHQPRRHRSQSPLEARGSRSRSRPHGEEHRSHSRRRHHVSDHAKRRAHKHDIKRETHKHGHSDHSHCHR